jgi:hypothetical protein
VLRSTDAEPVATLFQRIAETHAVPASVPLHTLLRTSVEHDQKPRFLIMLLVHTVALMRGENLSAGAPAPIGGGFGTRPYRCGDGDDRRDEEVCRRRASAWKAKQLITSCGRIKHPTLPLLSAGDQEKR